MRSRGVRIAVLLVVLLVAGTLVGAVVIAWHPAIPPGSPDRTAFAPEQIARGAALAAIGDCVVCHTTDGGRPYAGGRGVPTPFGTVFAPDPETGIGRWPEAAFRRVMRDGIDRAGRHLYPVLPYPHFTRASEADIEAMYAFLMTRAPVAQRAPRNRLSFPLNHRILLAGWNLLYLHPGAWHPDPAHDETWNRGAYLVEAVGHCGACHTPRNGLGAERDTRPLDGGEAGGWYAPALRAGSPAPRAWTAEALATYLRTGLHAQHGAAGGPMAAVTEALAGVPEADVRAIAVYIASLMPGARAEPGPTPGPREVNAETQAMFAGACGSCHAADAPMTRGGAPSLSLSTAVNAPTPQNVIEIILHGLPWREGKPAPYMPAFGDTLTDGQVAALADYLRAHYTDKPAWTDLAATVAKARHGGGA